MTAWLLANLTILQCPVLDKHFKKMLPIIVIATIVIKTSQLQFHMLKKKGGGNNSCYTQFPELSQEPNKIVRMKVPWDVNRLHKTKHPWLIFFFFLHCKLKQNNSNFNNLATRNFIQVNILTHSLTIYSLKTLDEIGRRILKQFLFPNILMDKLKLWADGRWTKRSQFSDPSAVSPLHQTNFQKVSTATYLQIYNNPLRLCKCA